MATPFIGLRIAGTKQRQAGFAPLVNVGVLSGGEGDNMDRVTMVAEKPAYIIKHASDYILYQLIDRQVKSFDADAPGVLSIALTIPKNQQLANDASPYRLIREIYEKFLEIYMEKISDGRNSFLNVDCDSELFRSILGQYPLEERKSSYIPMDPRGLTGIVCVSPSNMDDFFRNTQYKEFASYKDIEVGVNCFNQVSQGLDNLQIPLPPVVYSIKVKGKLTGETMQLPSDSYTAKVESDNLYTYGSVSFTLGDLLNAPNNSLSMPGGIISLDFRKNCINCDLKKYDILYSFVYKWTDNIGNSKDKIISQAKSGYVQLFFGDVDVTSTLWSGGQVKASYSRGREVVIKKSSSVPYKIKVSTDINSFSHQVVVTITINKPSDKSLYEAKQPPIVHSKTKSPSNVNLSYNYGDDMGGDTGQSANDSKNKIDIKSFLLGLLLGLSLGFGSWVTYSMINSENKMTPDGQAGAGSINDPDTMKQAVMGDAASKKQESTSKAPEKNGQQKDEGISSTEYKAEKAVDEAKIKKEAIEDLIEYVGSRPSLNDYKNHKGYKYLTNKQKIAIEAFLNLKQFQDKLNPQAYRKLENNYGSKRTFKSMSDIESVQKEISEFLNDSNNKNNKSDENN